MFWGESLNRGNCSKDTIADRAIASPNSLPKCSEGNLGEERQVSVSFTVLWLQAEFMPFTPPHKSSLLPLRSDFLTVRPGHCMGPGKTEGSWTQPVPGRDRCSAMEGSKNRVGRMQRRENKFVTLLWESENRSRQRGLSRTDSHWTQSLWCVNAPSFPPISL